MTPAGIEPATFRFLAQHLNPLNAELNPICYLLALLEAHHILHVSRIRVNHCATAVPRIDVVSLNDLRNSHPCFVGHFCGMDVKQGEPSGAAGEEASFTMSRRLY
jgi:hypothetical protein